MKKFLVFILALVLVSSMVVPVSATMAPNNLPVLWYEPVTSTVKTGGRAFLSVVAEGEDLKFNWIVNTCEDGKDHTFNFAIPGRISEFEALDSTGKMKVSFTTEKIDDKKIKHQLVIDNIIEFNYGAAATCTVSNEYGQKECDTAMLYSVSNAPAQCEFQMRAEFSVRREKLVKLACNSIIPKGAGYTDDDIEYSWYATADGNKDHAVYLDEHDPVLMADAYAPTQGPHFFFCRIYIRYGITDFFYETAVTHMTVYDPQTIITFDADTLYCDEDEDVTIKMDVRIEPEKDKGELSYRWYFGDDPMNMFSGVPGVTVPEITLRGDATAKTEYYTCVVTNETEDGFKFDNDVPGKPYVKVVFTGKPMVRITEQPKNVTVERGDDAKFTVKATGAKSYEWFIVIGDSSLPINLNDAGNDMAEGANSDTLTLHSENLSDSSVYCEIASESGKITTSDIATVKVKEPEYAEYPKITKYPEQVTAHVGDDVTLTVEASVSDGGTLHYKWGIYKAPDEQVLGNDITYFENSDSNTFKPDNTKAGEFSYVCFVYNVAEGKRANEPNCTGPVKVVFLEAIPEGSDTGSAAVSGDTTKKPSGSDGIEVSGPGPLVITLVAVISALVLALAGLGIFVLAKHGGKKNKK